MADARALFQAVKANALSDENNRLTAATVAANQATFSDNALWIGNSTTAAQDAVLAVANARLTAQTALVAAITLL
jgi:hypothetical protein